MDDDKSEIAVVYAVFILSYFLGILTGWLFWGF